MASGTTRARATIRIVSTYLARAKDGHGAWRRPRLWGVGSLASRANRRDAHRHPSKDGCVVVATAAAMAAADDDGRRAVVRRGSGGNGNGGGGGGEDDQDDDDNSVQ